MMQNQLLQMMLWIAMEPPEDMSAASIIEAKVELLRCIETLRYKPTASASSGSLGRRRASRATSTTTRCPRTRAARRLRRSCCRSTTRAGAACPFL